MKRHLNRTRYRTVHKLRTFTNFPGEPTRVIVERGKPPTSGNLRLARMGGATEPLARQGLLEAILHARTGVEFPCAPMKATKWQQAAAAADRLIEGYR